MSFALDIKTADDIAAEALAKAKARANVELLTYLNARAETLTSGVPVAEQLSWATKEVAALAHQSGTASAEQSAMLTAEASETGETLDDLAARIIARADTYRQAAGQIAGVRRRAQGAIAAATTIAEIDAVMAALSE